MAARPRPWTEQERLELAAELDSELDEYIDGLEKKSYAEGWPEDRWREEMDKHPFFMKNAPQPGDSVSPLLEGLQRLKYGEEENTPEELAANYKEDGNYNYKYKNYRLAITSYTQGIGSKCEDRALMAQLYSNRAAANFMLENYRSSLYDSKHAMKLDPTYRKAHQRAAECCFNTGDYEQCIELCDKYLDSHAANERVSELKDRAIMERKKAQRDGRMRESRTRRREKEDEQLVQTIRGRKIKIENDKCKGEERWTLRDLVPVTPQLAQHRVRMDESGRLIWPVTVLYPETLQIDFIQNFHEDIPMVAQLEDLFEVRPEWDREKRYVPANLRLYFEGPNKSSVHKVALGSSLGSVLHHEKYYHQFWDTLCTL